MTSSWEFTFTDEERRQLAAVLAMLVKKFANGSPVIESQKSPHLPQHLSPSQSPAVASSNPPQPVARDRWARDRQGKEAPNPKGCHWLTAHIFKAERADLNDGRARMRVAFEVPNGNGSFNASCWDEKLFPYLAAQSKEPSTKLYLVKNGKYLNVVGVNA
jgi:hypothetical protein